MPTTKLGWLLEAPLQHRHKLVSLLTEEERREFAYHWLLWARKEQTAPEGDWRVWLILAGRGFGKTRSGAEWVRSVAEANPDARIALVSASQSEARAVMVEGESGILACSPPERRPKYEASANRLRFANGAQAQLFSAADPESLRDHDRRRSAHCYRGTGECTSLLRCLALNLIVNW